MSYNCGSKSYHYSDLCNYQTNLIVRCYKKEIKQFSNFSKILFFSYRFTKLFGYKIFYFLISHNLIYHDIKHRSFEYKTLCIYVKDPFKSEYQLLINGREKVGIENFKNPRAFIDYSRIIDDVYENFKDYNPCVNIV